MDPLINELSICEVYNLHNDSEQCAAVGALRELPNCREGINMIEYVNCDEVSLVIEELFTN